MDRPSFSPRDEVYLKSTSFEVYIVTGLVFLFIFTGAFVMTVVWGMEALIWPAGVVAAMLAFAVLKLLAHREYRAKLNELTVEYTRQAGNAD